MTTTEKKRLYNRNYYIQNSAKLKSYQKEYRNKKKKNIINKEKDNNINERKMLNDSLILYFD